MKGLDTGDLIEEPVLLPQNTWLWKIFQTLSSQRWQFEGGPQAISMQDLNAILSIHDINESDKREEILYIVIAMDRVYLDHAFAVRKKEYTKQVRAAKKGK